jgi:hypothetical protein
MTAKRAFTCAAALVALVTLDLGGAAAADNRLLRNTNSVKPRHAPVPLAAFGALAGAVTAISAAGRAAYYGPYYGSGEGGRTPPLVTKQASGQF